MLRLRKLVLAMAAASALTSGMAHALGLGEIRLKSALDQPLEAEIELLDVRGLQAAELRPALAPVEEFGKIGIERPQFLSDLTFTPQLRSDGRGVIRVTSSQPVREPYLNFLIEVLWPSGRLLREYTVLLDPPLYTADSPAALPALPVAGLSPAAPVASAAPPLRATAPAPVASAPAAPRQTAAAVAPAVPAPASRADAPRLPTPALDAAPAEYRTHRDDTLWQIAARVRPSGAVSVQQTMLAIQQLNPGAFADGNINRLKTGQVLRLPDARQISARSQREALAEIERQNGLWRAARSQPAAVARQLDATGRSVPLDGTAQAPRADSLRLVSGVAGNAVRGSEGGVADGTAGLADRLALAEEQLATSRRENTELTERLGELQSQLAKLERLLELKNAQLAALQGTSGAPDAEEGAAALTTLAEAGSDTTGPVADADTAAQPQAAVQVSPPSLLDRLLADPTLLAAGGGALALLLALGLINARRRAAAEAEAESFESADGAFPSRVEPALAGLPVEEALALPAASDEIEQAIVYGRFTQAAELLRQALDAEPQRSDLRLQLMEVCAEMDDRDGFARQAAELAELGVAAEQVARLRERYPAMQSASAGELPVAGSLAGVATAGVVAAGVAASTVLAGPLPVADEPLSLDDPGLEPLSLDEAPESAPDAALPAVPEMPKMLETAETAETAEILDLAPGTLSSATASTTPVVVELSLDDLERSLASPADDELELSLDGDEAATKLELARVYLEMGDAEGARDILEEVLREGSATQQQEARELIGRIA